LFGEARQDKTAMEGDVMTQLNARARHRLISVGLYAFFWLFFLWPIYRILVRGFVTRSGHFTLQYVGLVFSDPELVRGLLNAIAIAAVVTILSLLISMPLAILSVRYEFP